MVHHSTFRPTKTPPEKTPNEPPKVPGDTVRPGKQPGERPYLAGHTRTNVSAAVPASDEKQTPMRALVAYTALPLTTRPASTELQRYLDRGADGTRRMEVTGWHVLLGLKARQRRIVAAGWSEALLQFRAAHSDLRLYHKNHCLRHRCWQLVEMVALRLLSVYPRRLCASAWQRRWFSTPSSVL